MDGRRRAIYTSGSPNERSKTSARSSLGIFGRALILLLRSADLASNVWWFPYQNLTNRWGRKPPVCPQCLSFYPPLFLFFFSFSCLLWNAELSSSRLLFSRNPPIKKERKKGGGEIKWEASMHFYLLLPCVCNDLLVRRHRERQSRWRLLFDLLSSPFDFLYFCSNSWSSSCASLVFQNARIVDFAYKDFWFLHLSCPTVFIPYCFLHFTTLTGGG